MLSIQSVRRLTALTLMAAAFGVQAHTAWLEPEPDVPDTWRVLFGGHGGPDDTEAYPPEKLGEVAAYGADGKPVTVTRSDEAEGVLIHAADASILVLHYDNGFWSRAGDESVNLPMNEVPEAESAVHAVKYGKTLLDWAQAGRVFNQAYELVLLNDSAPRAGETLRVQVRIDGQSAEGVAVMHEGDAPGARSDAHGIVELETRAGANRIWSGRRTTVEGDPRFTTLSIEYMLTFKAAER